MADLELINPRYAGGWKAPITKGMGNLNHFAGRFPSHIMIHNTRVEESLGFAKKSHHLLKRQDFSEAAQRNFLLRAMLDLDEYIVSHKIKIKDIDEAISEFYSPKDGLATNPECYRPFADLVTPVYLYLIDEQRHGLDVLFG